MTDYEKPIYSTQERLGIDSPILKSSSMLWYLEQQLGLKQEKIMPKVAYMDCYPTGPGTLAGKYLRMFWQPVYRSQDLQPGWAKPIKIMSEEFTLYRGDGGKPHVVGFRCPHRGT